MKDKNSVAKIVTTYKKKRLVPSIEDIANSRRFVATMQQNIKLRKPSIKVISKNKQSTKC